MMCGRVQEENKGGPVFPMSICKMFPCSKKSVVEHRAHMLKCCVDVGGKGFNVACAERVSDRYHRW